MGERAIFLTLYRKITFVILWVTRASYEMTILFFRYLSNERYKNKIWYGVFRGVSDLSNRQEYFDKFVGRTRSKKDMMPKVIVF
jgi:hypothetical protein